MRLAFGTDPHSCARTAGKHPSRAKYRRTYRAFLAGLWPGDEQPGSTWRYTSSPEPLGNLRLLAARASAWSDAFPPLRSPV